jgi:glycosyltransferase involved in cell wall biosynthesis
VKILYHHRTLGDGAEGIHVSAMVDAFRACGHDVRVAAMIGERTNVATTRTRLLTRFVRLMPRAAYELAELAYTPVAGRWLGREMEAWRPDLFYERYTLFNLAGLRAAKKAGVPFVLEVNAPLAYERAKYEQLAFARLARACERRACSGADRVVAVSTPLKDYLSGLGVRPEKITVVPNAADPAVFRPDAVARLEVRRRLGIPDAAVVAGFTGILRPWHGVHLLIEAVASIRPDARPHVLIVGDGPSRPELERLVGDRHLTGVTFTGRVPHETIPQFVAAFDIGVSPRATFYASPMKIPEYMAAGVAVIGPDTPNIRDLVDDGRTGLLFRAEDAADLAAVIERLTGDAAFRDGIGRAGRDEIVKHRTWRHNAEQVLAAVGAAT